MHTVHISYFAPVSYPNCKNNAANISYFALPSAANCKQHCKLSYISTDHSITLHYITLHHITLHYITLHHITLHYITVLPLKGKMPPSPASPAAIGARQQRAVKGKLPPSPAVIAQPIGQPLGSILEHNPAPDPETFSDAVKQCRRLSTRIEKDASEVNWLLSSIELTMNEAENAFRLSQQSDES